MRHLGKNRLILKLWILDIKGKFSLLMLKLQQKFYKVWIFKFRRSYL